MLKRSFIVIFSLVFAAIASGLVDSSQVRALSNQRLEIVKSNCKSSQVTLKQIQYSDTATRISRGRDYQQLIKLMATFNSRLALNKIDAGSTSTLTANMETQFDGFQQTFIKYGDQIASLINMNCQAKPADFYSQLEQLRNQRQSLAKEVDSISKLLDQYQKSVSQIAKQIGQGTK